MQPGDRSESGPLRPAGAFSATDAITKSDRDHVMKKTTTLSFSASLHLYYQEYILDKTHRRFPIV
ncbi:hypothetical protein [Cronobacter sakazakii]|uniref:hypothetical protein n=1 Tax=Cronobacter sakazakii TaxID=28141 RepID=UPI0003A2A8CA|nr:hypothetical protein [Cronobacter sakazakii]